MLSPMGANNKIRYWGIVLCAVVAFPSHGLCQSNQSQQKVSNNEISDSSSSGSNPIKNTLSNINNIAPHPPTGGSSVGGSGGNYREYGSAYYYPAPHQKHVVWNRDSYADAANDFGYNPQSHSSAHGSSHSFVPNTEYGVPEGHEHEEEGGLLGGSLGGLGGLGGLAGVLGVKGIKGLGILAVLKAGLPLLALLLPGLLLLPLVFLFLPVPVITIPSNPNGRNLHPGLKFGDISARMTQLARSVLNSEKCVERMSCELSKVSQGTFVDKALKRVFSKFEKHLPQQIQRMARAYMDQTSSHCSKKYACYLVDDNAISKSS